MHIIIITIYRRCWLAAGATCQEHGNVRYVLLRPAATACDEGVARQALVFRALCCWHSHLHPPGRPQPSPPGLCIRLWSLLCKDVSRQVLLDPEGRPVSLQHPPTAMQTWKSVRPSRNDDLSRPLHKRASRLKGSAGCLAAVVQPLLHALRPTRAWLGG